MFSEFIHIVVHITNVVFCVYKVVLSIYGERNLLRLQALAWCDFLLY